MSAPSVRRPLWPIILAILIALAIGEITGSLLGRHQQLLAAGSAVIPAAISSESPENKSTPTTFAPIVQKVMPSVVNIFSSRKVKSLDIIRDLIFCKDTS